MYWDEISIIFKWEEICSSEANSNSHLFLVKRRNSCTQFYPFVKNLHILWAPCSYPCGQNVLHFRNLCRGENCNKLRVTESKLTEGRKHYTNNLGNIQRMDLPQNWQLYQRKQMNGNYNVSPCPVLMKCCKRIELLSVFSEFSARHWTAL